MKNARMDEFEDYEYTVYPGLRILEKESNERYKLWEGYVKHEHGLVHFIQSHSYKPDRKYLRLSFISDGRDYQRTWSAFYGKKTIARLANEFIEDIKGGNDE
ncbi:hypothetical protein [Gracilimonas sediminicola]|uniref:Uncharacterized protein n=1 Tax=Gracilimonas sediminicola TaxID=2952158 RepID=A0A9X2L0J3_9BACT|nr:hypothetical protein [Gracilimonas sediminicola]MCP9290028.1 hypothetical protein [Gracilimonas sediminicola]